MARTIVLDADVVDQINRGNADAANALKSMVQAGDTIYVSSQAYKEMVNQPELPRTATANREFLQNLQIGKAPAGPSAVRLEALGQNEPGRTSIMSVEDALTAAQAKAINAEVFSLDRVYRNNGNAIQQRMGVRIAPETTSVPLAPTGAANDYRVGRRLMGLPPIEIGLSGNIIRNNDGGTHASIDPLPPTAAGGPSPKGEAIIGGMFIAFEGINYILNKINDQVQKKAVEKARDSVQADIASRRAADPLKGVLVVFFYKTIDAGDSLIRPGPAFDYLAYGFGVTRDEARQDMNSGGFITQGLRSDEKRTSEEIWIPPLIATSLTTARCPFRPYAVGQFFPDSEGRARLQGVSFDWMGGFDDTSEIKRALPAGVNHEFALLRVPAQVKWYNMNGAQPVDVPRISRQTANGNHIDVVDLDPHMPFAHACAAMVFPTTGATEAFFNTVSSTEGGGLLSSYINFSMIRWIRPQYIHLLRFL